MRFETVGLVCMLALNLHGAQAAQTGTSESSAVKLTVRAKSDSRLFELAN
jgi:hypothetical protein